MAPVYWACRLSLLWLLVWLSALFLNCYTLLIYDRQALLDIRNSVATSFTKSYTLDVDCSFNKTDESFTSAIPGHIRRWPLNIPRRKQRRKRGNRGGYIVKLKAHLWAGSLSDPSHESHYGGSTTWRLLDVASWWLCHVLPLHPSPVSGSGLHRIGLGSQRRGVTHRNLRALERASSSPVIISPPKMALLNARSLVNKTFLLNDFYLAHNLDFMFIMESWIKVGDLTPFSDLIPDDCTFFNSPRPSGRGGGIATILKNSLSARCRLVPGTAFSSFEAQFLHLNWNGPGCLVVIYRPPHCTKDFIQHFTELIGNIATNYDRFLLVGDFNIHVCCPSNPLSHEFLNIIDSFNLSQWISDATHIQGHTLDLVLSYGLDVTDIVLSDFMISDHKPILFTLSLPELSYFSNTTVSLSRFYSPQFSTNFNLCFAECCSQLHLDQPLSDLDADQHLSLLNSAWLKAANATAPLKPHKQKTKSVLWQNSDTRLLRQNCRKAERKWKQDRLHISLQMFRDSLTSYQTAAKSAKAAYFSNLIETNHSKPKVLFSIIQSVTNPSVNTLPVASDALCESFLRYFSDKITNLRLGVCPTLTLTISPIMSSSSAFFDAFEPISLQELKEVIDNLKPSFCSSDIIHPKFLKLIIDSIGPSLLSLINKCLQTGSVPADFKVATVTPLLKKPSLDHTVLKKFRPISVLPFISKVLEKIVLNQLQHFLTSNSIYEVFQSGFKSAHSTESALLRVLNDIYLSTDSGDSVVLILLDLSAAFDTIDHSLLLSRLESWVGLKANALKWFQSYLSDRKFLVKLGNFFSSPAPLTCGLPQGSILAPSLFSLYMLPLGSILRKHGVSFHFYADDTQIYLPVKKNNSTAITSLLQCLEEVKLWLAQNFLFLNEDKTEVIVFGPNENSQCISPELESLSVFRSSRVQNLGIIIDQHLKFDRHISSVIGSSFYQLRLLSKIKNFLTPKTLEMAVHAFVTSRLDYCNSLYCGISKSQIARLQLVQNAAARLLLNCRKHEHITPILRSLHWLPILSENRL
uniref:Reverse transcriptase domain-containing protein n=1 Tax=Cyprinus carpio TaxID=7962 RepID=A0A8C2BTF1_CYPCA